MRNTVSTNNQILLDRVLNQYNNEAYPEAGSEDLFELFTAQQILKDFDLPYDELESGLVGGSGDGGIDGMYLFVNGSLVQEDSNYDDLRSDIAIDLIIFQAKTHAGFQETPVERFITISPDLFELSGESLSTGNYNERLVEAIQRFRDIHTKLAPRFPTVTVSFFYASKGTSPAASVKHKVKKLKEIVTSSIRDAKFDFQFLGAEELCNLAAKQPRTTHSLQLAEMPISSDGQAGFVCLVKLPDFFDFIIDEKEALQKQLFEANVRDYQGHIKVNNEIQASLSSATEDFWWLNNGVSILATRASLSGKILTIQDPQIVNGLQTSKEVYNYYKDKQTANESRKILVRVMVPNEEASRDRIIKATNSQNVVPAASLRATDRIHRNIEEYLKPKGLFYDRRKNHYKNEGKPRDKIVGIPYLAQSVMAIALRQPNQARARPSSLLKDDDDYCRVFNLEYPINLYYVCAEGMRKIESCLKLPSLNVELKNRNNIKFYVAMHAIAGVGSSMQAPEKIAEFNVSSLDEVTVKRSLNFIMPKYVALGGNDQVSKGTGLLEVILHT